MPNGTTDSRNNTSDNWRKYMNRPSFDALQNAHFQEVSSVDRPVLSETSEKNLKMQNRKERRKRKRATWLNNLFSGLPW